MSLLELQGLQQSCKALLEALHTLDPNNSLFRLSPFHGTGRLSTQLRNARLARKYGDGKKRRWHNKSSHDLQLQIWRRFEAEIKSELDRM